jgi:hypothetical protein
MKHQFFSQGMDAVPFVLFMPIPSRGFGWDNLGLSAETAGSASRAFG